MEFSLFVYLIKQILETVDVKLLYKPIKIRILLIFNHYVIFLKQKKNGYDVRN